MRNVSTNRLSALIQRKVWDNRRTRHKFFLPVTVEVMLTTLQTGEQLAKLLVSSTLLEMCNSWLCFGEFKYIEHRHELKNTWKSFITYKSVLLFKKSYYKYPTSSSLYVRWRNLIFSTYINTKMSVCLLTFFSAISNPIGIPLAHNCFFAPGIVLKQ